MDIPFIRFAFPVLILCAYWHTFVTDPWVDPTPAEMSGDPNHLSPDAARKLLDESRGLLEQEKYNEAVAPLLRLRQAFPESAIYLQSLAQTYEHLARYQDAVQLWEQFLQYSPTPIEACPQIGLDYRELGEAPEALRSFERCHTIEENADTLLFLANALEREGQFRRALDLYQKAVERAPDYSDAGVGLARVEARLGQVADARPRIETILKGKPDDVEALLTAGLVYAQLGEKSRALTYLRHAHQLAPGYGDIDLIMRKIRREGNN